ncbi:MAG TPA: dockerin type I repeat-containing protein [Tepidisphaeraceae bacterium]|nr:dockerin type I repeat-containing protein [Tepidisphaeraceae bacterium]
MNRSFPTRRLLIAAAITSTLSASPPARAVLFYSTSDPTYNTTAPAGSIANAAWQYEGQWSSFTGTAIAPQYFITANHVGGAVGNTFSLNGVSYTTVPFPDGSSNKRISETIAGTDYVTDLVIWKIAGTFPTFAPLYNASIDGAENVTSSVANPAVVIGRGTQRGSAVTLNGDTRGWNWGASDSLLRWGTNVISTNNTEVSDGNSTGLTIAINFDANPLDRPTANPAGYSGVNEATISSGDSGGGIFIKNALNQWKLAGINWALPEYSTTSGGSAIAAALYDAGGYYSGTTFIPDTTADVPQPAYASSISANLGTTTTVGTISYILANSYAWNVNASGNWSTGSNWWNANINLGSSPTAPASTSSGKEIVFGSVITAPITITLASNKTVGSLVFDGANAYTLAGSTLILDSSTTTSVNVNSGSHTIASNLTLNKDSTFTLRQSTSTLTISGALSAASTTTLTKAGSGTLKLSSSTPAHLGNLSISAGAIDLTTTDLILEPSDLDAGMTTLRTYLQSRQIFSSTADADPQHIQSIAYASASSIGMTTWDGQTLSANSLITKFTYAGDANLDGKITSDDYALLDRGIAKNLTGWINGDFNYDGIVNAADYAILDRSFALQSGTLSPDFLAMRESQFGNAYVQSLLTSLPEPSLLFSTLATIFIYPRRIATYRRIQI